MQNSVAKKLFAVGSAAALAVGMLAPVAMVHAAAHAAGTNVSSSDGTVWMIMPDGTRRAYTSAGAFLSYGFNSWSQVVPANADDLALSAGSFIPPQDGSIICSDRGTDKGTCYEVSNGQKYGFTSAAVFLGLGFSFSNAPMADVSWMVMNPTLLNSTTMGHLPGTLVNNNGTVQLVGNSGALLGIPDLGTFNSWGYSFGKVVPANAMDKTLTQSGVMVARQPGQLSPSGTTTPCTSNCTNPPVVSGPISVQLASDNPAAGTVVSGQAAADLAHFAFTGSGSISQVTLQRMGVSANSALNNVYLFQGNQRITDAASVNTSGQILFNNLNLNVNGGTTLSVRADIATALTSGTVGVTLTGYTTTGNSPSTVNISGNTMVIASGSGVLAGVDIKKSGVLTPTSGSTVSANAGTTSQTFWQTNVQVNTHSVWLKGVQFQMIGSAPTDALSHIQLYVNGAPVGSMATMGSNGYVFFDLSGSPVTLQTGSTQIGVLANIEKGSNRSVQFALQNAADFMVTDSQLNVGVAPTVDSAAFAPVTAGTINIASGSLNAVIDPTFQSLTNVTGGATNAVIGRFKLHAYGEDVKVMTLVASTTVAAGTPATNQLNNVALYFGSNPSSLGQVGSSQASAGTSNLTFNLGSSLVVPAGTDSFLEVRADIQNTANTSYTAGTITTALLFGSSTGQGMSSLNTTGVLPSGTLTTTGLTIQTGTLSVGKSSYSNQTMNPNMANQKIAEFTLQNQSSSEGVRVTNIEVKLYGDTGLANLASGTLLTNLSNLKTDETSGNGATPINPTTDNNFSVNFTLAPGASKTVGIYADSSTLAAGTLVVTMKPTAFGANSGVTVTPSAFTQGQTISLAGGTFNAPTFQSAQSSVTQFVAAAGGATDAGHNVFTFTASNGVATISELKFAVLGTAGSVTSVKVGNVSAPVVTPPSTTLTTGISSGATSIVVGDATNIQVGSVLSIASSTATTEVVVVSAVSGSTLTVTRAANGTTAIAHSAAEVITINGTAYLTGLNIAVPNAGSGVTVDALPTYASVGSNGINSSSTAAVLLSYDKHTIGGVTTAEAITTAPAGNTVNLVGSRPTLAVTTTSNAGLIVGENHVFDVTVTPDPKGSIQVNTLVFNISTTTSITSITAPRLAIGSTTITGSGYSCTGSITITCTLPSGYILSGPQTFSLFITIGSSGLGASGTSSVTASLGAASTFSWADIAGAGTSAPAVTGGTNTVYLNNYPTQTWSAHN